MVVMTCVKLVKAILVGSLDLTHSYDTGSLFFIIPPNRRTKGTMALEMNCIILSDYDNWQVRGMFAIHALTAIWCLAQQG